LSELVLGEAVRYVYTLAIPNAELLCKAQELSGDPL
jgi:hypothetical protein